MMDIVLIEFHTFKMTKVQDDGVNKDGNGFHNYWNFWSFMCFVGFVQLLCFVFFNTLLCEAHIQAENVCGGLQVMM